MAEPFDRHRRLRAVFEDALHVDPARRPGFLAEACGGDAELLAHVQRLLGAHHDLDSFLAQPIGLTPSPATPDFAGTDRFTVVRQLGVGGMGVVYEVHDRLRHETVALKTLRRASAADLYRLKREFRSLADVTHPNLVCLYELVVDDAQSFFTMELVDGVTFVEYVRGQNGSPSLDRLATAAQQLVAGISALHRRGKLHRDIKPSNVLVTGTGRLVILDFGLTAESTPLSHSGDWAGGTPAFMAPEEITGTSSGPASDWYAVGVTLYEALTGSLPFAGPLPDVLRAKQETDPVAPASLAPQVPSHLSDLCMGLLSRDPNHRLTGSDIQRVLTRTAGHAAADVATGHDALFVGREESLYALQQARYAVMEGAPRAAAVYGPSGIGKSALIRRFVRDASSDGAIVLAGRCYENESVPYKALDGVVDDLSRYLAARPRDEVRETLSTDVAALTRLFPVLLQVDAIASMVRRSARTLDRDPVRVRRLAIEALRTLLERLADDHRLIVWIDDLQWADADSVVLLDELLATPPVMLTLLSFRQEEIAAKPFLQAIALRSRSDPGWSAVPLLPMTAMESQLLIDGLVSSRTALSVEDREALAREAAGSPFVLEQLALHAGGSGRSLTMSGMLEARLSTLERQERAFLETLALCGRPVAPDVVCDACGLDRDRQSVVVRLRTSRLIRSSGSTDRVETYHDRIREAVAGQLSADESRLIHRSMATSLEARGSDDCEALFEHYRGAQDHERASAQAILAAGKTSTALAFDRAAFFYEQALTLTPSDPRAASWREALATALANAGRPPAAAEAYLAAAAGSPTDRRVELQRRAAEQFLVGGHIDRGLGLMQQLLTEVGVSSTRTPRSAAAWVVLRRARQKWRGLHFVPREPDSISPDMRQRLDTSWAVGTGLALVDVLSASNFLAQHLRMALDAGDRARIVRGAALEWSARNADWPYRAGSAPLRDLAAQLVEEVGTPQATATLALADSITAVATGQWRHGLRTSERALTILREQCVGVTWETTIATNIHLWSLMYLGELGEVCRRVPEVLDDARRRGNLYLATEVCTRSNFVWLAADDPDGGEREVATVMASWSQHGFHRQHYSAMLARVQTALYRGQPQEAWDLFEQQRANLDASMLTRVQALRVESLYLRARTAIAVAASDPAHRSKLSLARRCADRIGREQMPWSDPLGLLLHGCIASVEGRRDQAVDALQRAVERFERAEMGLYLAVARRRLGQVRADEEGRRIQRDAEAWMARQQIRNPVCLSRMFAPGFPDEPVLTD